MLVFSTFKNLIANETDIIFNLSSLREGYDRISLLPQSSLKYDIKEFDLEYYNYIMNNDNVFFELMKVITPLYNGQNVFLLIGEGEVYDFVAESLQKMIQQRYGINSYFINDKEDYEDIKDKTNFSIQGLYNFDIDKEKYTNMLYEIYGENELGRVEI